jgi:4a-hydroxytetrahydrobiopterin dehydratase
MHSNTNNTKLSKEYKFSDFASALEFVNKVGDIAETLGHHPEIYLTWGRVIVESCTHDQGNKVTDKDMELMKKIEQVYQG